MAIMKMNLLALPPEDRTFILTMIRKLNTANRPRIIGQER
jgi:hypothetical protein